LTPSPLPAWFAPWTLHRFGLGPRPPYPKHITKEVQWVLDEWERARVWMLWVKAGRPSPRPAILWRNKTGEAISPSWAVKLRRALDEHKPHPDPPPIQPTPVDHFKLVPSKTVGRSGLYFYDYPNSNIDEARIIQLCKEHNLWIALLVHELGRAPQPDFNADETRKRYQAQGITVVATGWLDSNYDLDAQADAAHRLSQGYDEYMGNMEATWKWEYGQDAFNKMDTMAPELRSALGPNMPLSVSCEWGQVSKWRPLLEAGLSAIRPQCYMDEWPHMSPKEAIIRARWGQGDLPNGISSTCKVEPTYGQQRATSPPLSTWTAYDDEISRPAKSVWNARHCQEPDVLWLTRR
jgi:hypothetical protein